MNLSCVILAKNEEDLIGECIKSCQLLDPLEVLVLDDGSIDDTQSRAEFAGAIVVKHKKKNFAEARNFVHRIVKGEWILYIDADERVTQMLAGEIKSTLSNSVSAYSIPRTNFYLGKKWPMQENMLRLIKKSALDYWYGELHESPKVNGEIVYLKAPLFHFTHKDLFEMVENTVSWSEIEARLRFDAKHPPITWWRIIRMMHTTIFDYYIKQRGWQVGAIGLIESIYQGFSMFITYARLWELQQKLT